MQSLSKSYRVLGVNSTNCIFDKRTVKRLVCLGDEAVIKCYKYHTSQFIQQFAVESERTIAPPAYDPVDWFFNQHTRCYITRRCSKFKYAFQLWQAKRAVTAPLPASVLASDYEQFKARLTEVNHTDPSILDRLREMSKEYFAQYEQPDLLFHTTTKACHEHSSHKEYVKEKYQIPDLPSVS